MFEPIQHSFAGALLDPGRAVPAALTSHTAKIPAKRFAVYRNNVVVGLIHALARRFPVVERIVGEEFFAAMARVFVVDNPPRSPLLMVYGDAFPDFIAGFDPAAELPYLACVARLEAARTRAYHAADAIPLDPAVLRSLDQETLGDLRIVRHPAAEIVRSKFPIVTIWAMNAGEIELGPVADWSGEDALVARPGLEVEVRGELGTEQWHLIFLAKKRDRAFGHPPAFDLGLAGIPEHGGRKHARRERDGEIGNAFHRVDRRADEARDFRIRSCMSLRCRVHVGLSLDASG